MPKLTTEQREEIRAALRNRLRIEALSIANNERLEAALVNSGLDFNSTGMGSHFLLHYGSDWDRNDTVSDEILDQYLENCTQPLYGLSVEALDALRSNILREGMAVDLDVRDEDNARFLFGEYGPEVAKEAREAAKNPMPCPPLRIASHRFA